MFDLFSQQILWQPADEAQLSVAVADWLLDPNSLTQRLRQLSDSEVRVKLLKQATREETYPFLAPKCQSLWSRQVELYNDDGPLIEAHTLIAQSDIDTHLSQLKGLGQRPLGEVIFAQPDLKRISIEVAQVAGHWARRSLLNLHQCNLVVAERYNPLICPHSK